MVSSQSNRATFITSIKAFMAKYKFQGKSMSFHIYALLTEVGVDLDWEVPQNSGDKTGYLALVKEMNAAFAGTSFKTSIAFPVDYGDMFWIDAKGMEPYLDSIGYMAYDQGNADGTVSAHTDIIKTAEHALPFWFAGVNPAKINLGLASYGRGFTLAGKANSSMINIPWFEVYWIDRTYDY